MSFSPKRRILSGAAAFAVAAGGSSFLSAPSALALGPGDHFAAPALVVGENAATPVTSGNSSTKFTLKLPQGAACTQDSANFGFRVNTYMVPASVDPNALAFGSDGPLGPPSHQPLFDQFQTPYVSGQTANADPPGRPGFIINLPATNYEVFPPGFITPGDYNIGVACIGPQGQLDKFYNVQKTFTADPSAGTSELSFVVLGEPPPVVPGVPMWVILPLTTLGLLGCGALILGRRRSALATGR